MHILVTLKVDISLTYGNTSGNTEIDKAGSDAGTEYNNLENHTYSAKIGVAGFTGIYRLHMVTQDKLLQLLLMEVVKVTFML